MDLSIILPTYNEKNNIVNLVNQILEVIKNIENKEIIPIPRRNAGQSQI